ncbi:uncharacterized protein LOC131207108 [Anopheles bellator]|uniref:uncharacterized protein LOC131207108 n=1 Tax=Anopheles bellator TaxID=139047 RepID=UPI0026470E72|nr:uncharacterized protein LOC131207108 [Anopheles bellator]
MVFNECYKLLLISLLLTLQIAIYQMHIEEDFAGWFISTSTLLTCFVVIIQSLVSSKGLRLLLQELTEIDCSVGATFCVAPTRGAGSATLYALYAVGLLRGIFRTALMVVLAVRPFWIALCLLAPSLIILVRINLQIYLMQFIGLQLRAILDELSSLTADAGADCELGSPIENVQPEEARCAAVLQRTERVFGRLQKCLIRMNSLFGWSTAAIVVFSFVLITFQLRYPLSPLPLYASLIDVLHAILFLFMLCHASTVATSRVADIERALLKPSYRASFWDQVNHFAVRIQLHPFEFTANGLYAINYGLFCSTLAASATYIVIMFQFDQKTP